ncbi:MAG: tyrosine-type recombinase/integrase [Clostridiales bacterium]|nr:tyrosine-type recombinase/integrase [Clostridiales bacterium]
MFFHNCITHIFNFQTKRFKQILVRNNLDIIRFHDLRHSTASYLLYLGFNMKEIQSWLGHRGNYEFIYSFRYEFKTKYWQYVK